MNQGFPGKWPGKQVSLRPVAATLNNQREFVAVFDPFSGYIDSQGMGQADDCFHDGEDTAIFWCLHDKRSIDCYYFFSGLERLRRRGAEIHEHRPNSTSHGHGDWALRPSSLDLAVIIVSQQESKDSSHNDLPSFASFKSHHPTGLQADWMYGGSTLIFYDATGSQPRDGIETIADIECRVISEEQVRMHARDLDRLADRLEAIDAGDTPLGALPPTR